MYSLHSTKNIVSVLKKLKSSTDITLNHTISILASSHFRTPTAVQQILFPILATSLKKMSKKSHMQLIIFISLNLSYTTNLPLMVVDIYRNLKSTFDSETFRILRDAKLSLQITKRKTTNQIAASGLAVYLRKYSEFLHFLKSHLKIQNCATLPQYK